MPEEHRCDRRDYPKLWDKAGSGRWGAAIETCELDDKGELWVTNDEYSSRVNFCPFCGWPAPSQAPKGN
jgi:hypothetical protein